MVYYKLIGNVVIGKQQTSDIEYEEGIGKVLPEYDHMDFDYQIYGTFYNPITKKLYKTYDEEEGVYSEEIDPTEEHVSDTPEPSVEEEIIEE